MSIFSIRDHLPRSLDYLKLTDTSPDDSHKNSSPTSTISIKTSLGFGSGSLSGRTSYVELRREFLAPDTVAGESVMSRSAVDTAIANDSSGLEAAKQSMRTTLSKLASDPEKFHEVMKNSFGATYDQARAETIRQQILDNDFSGLPDIKVVSQSELTDQSGTQGSGTALGAYSKDNDTIYISRELLASDPAKAAQILTEEVGHALDARLNTSDAAGDEGEIFSRLAGGEVIPEGELAALKAENDSGTIVVDGKEVEVEYGFLSSLKKKVSNLVDGVKDAVKGVGNLVKGAWDAYAGLVENVWDAHKRVFEKVAQSKVFQVVLTVAQFVPIPVVQIAARVVNLAMAAYNVAQGVKNGSLSAVLSGVAGVAGGAASLGSTVGASARFINGAAKVAKGAEAASMAYGAVARRDFASAAGLAGQFFGVDTRIGQSLTTAGNAYSTVNHVKNGDYLSAFRSGKDTYGGVSSMRQHTSAAPEVAGKPVATVARAETSKVSGLAALVDGIKGSRVYQAIAENVPTIRDVVKLVKNGDHQQASELFLKNYADDLGIAQSTQSTINTWAGVLDKVSGLKSLVDDNNYSATIGQAAQMLGLPLSTDNQQRIETVFALRDSVLSSNYATASRQAATLSLQSGKPELAVTFLQLANFLEGNLTLPSIRNTQSNAA